MLLKSLESIHGSVTGELSFLPFLAIIAHTHKHTHTHTQTHTHTKRTNMGGRTNIRSLTTVQIQNRLVRQCTVCNVMYHKLKNYTV